MFQILTTSYADHQHIVDISKQKFQCGASFVDPFFIICVSCLSVILSCLFLAALWSPAGEKILAIRRAISLNEMFALFC